MVDMGRHYLTLRALKRQIRGLFLAKMNVLHIHIVDCQANGFAPDTEPAKAMRNGAWYYGEAFILGTADLKDLATYAKDLGVFI